MKFTQTKPCGACPFRKKSAPGWLGDSTPEDFIATTLDDSLMPCHKTVDYDDPEWRDKMIEMDSKVQHCAGARIFYKNQCKMTRNVLQLYLEKHGAVKPVEKSADVFLNRAEFLAHHTKFGDWRKLPLARAP